MSIVSRFQAFFFHEELLKIFRLVKTLFIQHSTLLTTKYAHIFILLNIIRYFMYLYLCIVHISTQLFRQVQISDFSELILLLKNTKQIFDVITYCI